MKYRICHIPQVGVSEPFYVDVNSPQEGWKVFDILTQYDLFQFENKLKPYYCSACFLEYFDEEENEWLDWYDDDGLSFEEHFTQE